MARLRAWGRGAAAGWPAGRPAELYLQARAAAADCGRRQRPATGLAAAGPQHPLRPAWLAGCLLAGVFGIDVRVDACGPLITHSPNKLQIQWLARTLRYWNKLAGLSPRSLLGGTFVANVAAGLGCGRGNVWAAELRAALQFVCPDPGWTAHMLQGKPIDVAPVVAAAQQACCAELHTYTGAPGDDSCANRNFCKYVTHMVQGGNSAEHDELPTPAYVATLAPLAKKRALAQMRLSGAPIETNLQRGAGAVPYSQRICPLIPGATA